MSPASGTDERKTRLVEIKPVGDGGTWTLQRQELVDDEWIAIATLGHFESRTDLREYRKGVEA